MKILSCDIWSTLLRANPEYVAQRTSLIAECIAQEHSLDAVAKAIGEAYRELDAHINADGTQFGFDTWVKRTAAALGADEPSHSKLVEFEERLVAAQLQYLPAFTEPDLVDTFRGIASTGVKIAVISNTSMTRGVTLKRSLELLGLGQFIEFYLFSDEFGCNKPDPRIFNALVEQAGVTPNDILHVGDNPIADVQGAINAGMHALHYTPKGEVTPTTFTRLSELRNHPLWRTLTVTA
ncbi:MAG TPA: HAD-IA family hydrolase [Magnetospirillaceae bacterium]|nr:HAD-IA family hydrolase [Magnetospirillaceae bacterium]